MRLAPQHADGWRVVDHIPVELEITIHIVLVQSLLKKTADDGFVGFDHEFSLVRHAPCSEALFCR